MPILTCSVFLKSFLTTGFSKYPFACLSFWALYGGMAVAILGFARPESSESVLTAIASSTNPFSHFSFSSWVGGGGPYFANRASLYCGWAILKFTAKVIRFFLQGNQDERTWLPVAKRNHVTRMTINKAGHKRMGNKWKKKSFLAVCSFRRGLQQRKNTTNAPKKRRQIFATPVVLEISIFFSISLLQLYMISFTNVHDSFYPKNRYEKGMERKQGGFLRKSPKKIGIQSYFSKKKMLPGVDICIRPVFIFISTLTRTLILAQKIANYIWVLATVIFWHFLLSVKRGKMYPPTKLALNSTECIWGVN